MIEVEAHAEVETDLGALVRRVTWTCERLGIRDASVGLMVVGAERMRAINREHRAIDRPTDVLSFLVDGPEAREGWPEDGPPPELGDVVICPEASEEPLPVLAVHGVLHLLGYDHETDAGEMLALQDRLVDEAPA